jgi:dTDP-4-amino-4,6-dideoxygalactose transaminase
MHYGGYIVDREAWRRFADDRRLFLIEDSAHAVGLGLPAIFGDAAVFSFFGNKNMTTAEGGMVVAADEGVLNTVRQARSHGMTSGTLQRLHSRTPTYDVTMLGYNYRMDELRAAVGLVQVKNLARWNEMREGLTRAYRTFLEQDCPEVTVPFSCSRTSSYHILPVLLPLNVSRQQIAEELRTREIQTSVHYPPVHKLSWYRRNVQSCTLTQTEEFAARELTLPLYPKMQEWQVRYVTLALSDALGRSYVQTRH